MIQKDIVNILEQARYSTKKIGHFGLNLDFFSLFSEWDPRIYLGGDNVAFWGPLAKTVIFGLSFATFLTLVIVPSIFLILYKLNLKIKKVF